LTSQKGVEQYPPKGGENPYRLDGLILRFRSCENQSPPDRTLMTWIKNQNTDVNDKKN